MLGHAGAGFGVRVGFGVGEAAGRRAIGLVRIKPSLNALHSLFSSRIYPLSVFFPFDFFVICHFRPSHNSFSGDKFTDYCSQLSVTMG